MQLTSNRGRVVDLAPDQAAEFLRIVATAGEGHARCLAFSGLLYSQLGPEGVAARERAKEMRIAALREQRREAVAACRRIAAAWQALLRTFPELHPVVQRRILQRNRAGYTVSRYALWQGKPVVPDWEQMSAQQRKIAQADAKQMLIRLNANDWRRIREKTSQEHIERMVNFAGPEVLALLL